MTNDLRRANKWLILLGVFLGSLGNSFADAAETKQPRFRASFSDGTFKDSDQFVNWFDDKTQPTLQGQQLFAAANPMRWLMDRSQPLPEQPKAYVEFIGGDRMPGRVITYHSGTENIYRPRQSYLLIEPSIDLTFPGRQWDVPLRVATRWLKRVVWESQGGISIPPSTARLKDGRQFKFRSLRWRKDRIALLLEEGIQQFDYGQLAEIHFAVKDHWDAYYDQLAVLTPNCDKALLQIETSNGLTATTSMDRFQAHFSGDKRKSDNWLQTIQPAWSLDPICVRVSKVWMWRHFLPHQVPLCLVAPTSVEQKSTFGSGWRWQLNRSVTGELLETGGQQFGSGFGVHAMCRLQFPLPLIAAHVKSRIGLERSVGSGGCAKGIIALSTTPDQPLWQTDIMIGAANYRDSGLLNLTIDPSKQANLVLTADPVIDGRPQGADPFDIRDSVNWVDPELWLHSDKLKAEVAQRFGTNLAMEEDWELEGSIARKQFWDTSFATDPRYTSVIRPTAKFVKFRRELDIGRRDAWLSVIATRPTADATLSQCVVSVNGKALAEFEIPARVVGQHPNPVVIPVRQFQGKEATVELTQIATDDKSWVDWQAVLITEMPPGLLRVFEDEASFPKKLKFEQEEFAAILHEEMPYRGASCVKILTPMATLGKMSEKVVIRETPAIGEYRYLRFAWKKPVGDMLCVEIGHDGRFGAPGENDADIPIDRNNRIDEIRQRNGRAFNLRGNTIGFRYDQGTGTDEYEKQVRLGSSVPREWGALNRDLYTELGDFNFTGLRLRNFEGEAQFDHIYLARSNDDFRFVDELLKPFDTPPEDDENVLIRTRNPLRWGTLISKVAPAFSTRAVGDNVEFLKEFRGRKNVLKTMPVKQGEACVLRTALNIPKDKKTRLEMTVSHHDEATDWQLIVKANGAELHNSMINKDTVKEDWLDVNVDLSGLAGQQVILELYNHPNNWSYEFGYWHKVAIISE